MLDIKSSDVVDGVVRRDSQLAGNILTGEFLYYFLLNPEHPEFHKVASALDIDLSRYGKEYIIPNDYYDIIDLRAIREKEVKKKTDEETNEEEIEIIKEYTSELIPGYNITKEVRYKGKDYICKFSFKVISIEHIQSTVSVATKEDPNTILIKREHNIKDNMRSGYFMVVNYEAIVRCLVSQYEGLMIDIRCTYRCSYENLYWFMYLTSQLTQEDKLPKVYDPNKPVDKIGDKVILN